MLPEIGEGVALEAVTLSPAAFIPEILSADFMTVRFRHWFPFADDNSESGGLHSGRSLAGGSLCQDPFTDDSPGRGLRTVKGVRQILSPRALSVHVLSPEALLVEILSPKFFESRVLSPEVLIVEVLSPGWSFKAVSRLRFHFSSRWIG